MGSAIRLAGLLIALAMAAPAQALRLVEIEVVCPVDGKPFKAWLMGSGTAFGVFFDQRQIGPIASPAPLPECPGSKFVVDPDRAYDEADRGRIRALVATDQYRQWNDETPWYRLAKQEQALGAKPEDIAFVLLQATWQAGTERYPRYAAEALAALKARAAKDAGTPATYHARLLTGELERRLEHFEQAHATFQTLRDDPGFPGQADGRQNAYMRKILEAQLQLVGSRDSRPARLDEDGNIVHF